MKTKKKDNNIEKQRELARERQRKHRKNMSEEDLERKRAKDRERYIKLKEKNKIKTVKDLTPREHRRLKKQWRERKARSNLRKKHLDGVMKNNTPPHSEDEQPNVSEQKKRGRKLVRKDRSKSYRTIKKLTKEKENFRKKYQKYKKKFERERSKNKIPTASPSPRKKVTSLVGKSGASPQVKKQLFLHFVLKRQLKEQMLTVKSKTKKQQLMIKVLGSKTLRRYRVQKHFTDLIPYKLNKRVEGDVLKYDRKRKICSIDKHSLALRQFFEDDTVSRMTPGKRDFATKHKNKKQVRILLDTKKNLFKRFVSETGIKLSFSTFLRACPYWVRPAKLSDRDTCACKVHQNFELKVFSLKNVKVIKQNNTTELLNSLVCSTKEEACMTGLCVTCGGKKPNFSYNDDFLIKYEEWNSVQEERNIKGRKKTVKKCVKERKYARVSQLLKQLEKELEPFKKHVFSQIHQASKLKELRANIDENELVFRVDFSENYVTKSHIEIQSAHFGASKHQITLNTGVMYSKEEGKTTCSSFCTVSENLDHQSHAVWAHMEPVLLKAASKHPNTKVIHFFSDGPSSQYKNRYNIFLMKTLVPRYYGKLEKMTWNYTEAGHGKGPMDGIGGVLKRRADETVNHGKDITSAQEFVDILKNTTKIDLMTIPDESFGRMKKELEGKIPEIKNITLAKQITWSKNCMYSRTRSCFKCAADTYCDHYTLGKVFEPPKSADNKTNARNKKKIIYSLIYSSSEEEEEKKQKADILKRKITRQKTLPKGKTVNMEVGEVKQNFSLKHYLFTK